MTPIRVEAEQKIRWRNWFCGRTFGQTIRHRVRLRDIEVHVRLADDVQRVVGAVVVPYVGRKKLKSEIDFRIRVRPQMTSFNFGQFLTPLPPCHAFYY